MVTEEATVPSKKAYTGNKPPKAPAARTRKEDLEEKLGTCLREDKLVTKYGKRIGWIDNLGNVYYPYENSGPKVVKIGQVIPSTCGNKPPKAPAARTRKEDLEEVAATMDDGIDRNSVHRVDVDDSDNNNNNAYIIAEDDHDDEFSYEGSNNIPETYKDKQVDDFFDALNDNFTFDAGFDSGQKAIVPCLCPCSNKNKKWQEQVEKCGATPKSLMDHLQRNGRNNEFVLHRGVKTYLKELHRR